MTQPPTERQFAFLLSLGVPIDQRLSREEVSGQIEAALQTADSEPPTGEQKLLAAAWGVKLSWENTRKRAGKALFDAWEEDPQRDVPDALVRRSGRSPAVMLAVLAVIAITGFIAVLLFGS